MASTTGLAMQSRWARVARGGAAAAFATAVAAVSHGVAGGMGPSGFGVLASFLISFALCTMLAGRTVSLVRLAIAVLASQFLFHGLFSTLGMPHSVGHSHAALPFVPDTALLGAADASMWGGHLVAAVLTILALRFGEAAFWALGGLARMVALPTADIRPTLIAVPRLVVAARARVVALAAPLLSSMRHRGPPARIAAA